jgi:hypothetical protein
MQQTRVANTGFADAGRQVYRVEHTPAEFIVALETAEPPAETAQFDEEVPEGWDRPEHG